MSITKRNAHQIGVIEIIQDSVYEMRAMEDRAASFDLDARKQEVDNLIAREKALFEQLGDHLNSPAKMKAALKKFRDTYTRLTGLPMGMEFTFPYGKLKDKLDFSLKEFYEKYLVKYVEKKMRAADTKQVITSFMHQYMSQFLNLTLTAQTSSNFTVTSSGISGPRRRGGQVGSKSDQPNLSNLAKDLTQGEIARVREFMNAVKTNSTLERDILDTLNIKVNPQGDSIIWTLVANTNEAGAKWIDRISNQTGATKESEIKKDLAQGKITDDDITAINKEIKLEIQNKLGFSSGTPEGSAYETVITDMLKENRFLFWKGGNYVDVSGLIGEIGAMVFFEALTGTYPSIEWAAQHKDLGKQASADITIKTLLDELYGVQVKNSAEDVKELEDHYVKISKINYTTLGEGLGFDSTKFSDIFDAYNYNIEYRWKKSGGKTRFFPADNPRFAPTRKDLELATDQFNLILARVASALLFMNTDIATFQSGDIGNDLYIVNFELFVASEILNKILEEIEKGRVKSLQLVSSYSDAKKNNITTIDKELPGIWNGENSGFYATQTYLTSSYNFK